MQPRQERIIFSFVGDAKAKVQMAKSSTKLQALSTTATRMDKVSATLAGLAFADAPSRRRTKFGSGMTTEDRREKLGDKICHQKAILAPGYTAAKTKKSKDKNEGWYSVQPNG